MLSRLNFVSISHYYEYLQHYYAGLALQAMISNPVNDAVNQQNEHLAESALAYANALVNKIKQADGKEGD